MTTLSLFALPEPESEQIGVAQAERELTREQLEAVERRDGPLFVHAGAGTGKTRVLVERFVRAVLDDGVSAQRMLAITFTEKAAAELRGRIRARFLSAGEREHARASDSAWISTIHGFCSRLLRSHALSAGLDPDYRVLADHEADRLAAEGFDAALEDFLGAGDAPARVALVAAHGPDRLAHAVRRTYAQLRGSGEHEPTLPQPQAATAARIGEAHDRLARAVHAARGRLDDVAEPARQVRAARERLDRCAQLLAARGDDAPLDPLDLRTLGVARGNARILRGAAFDELDAAHAACLDLCARNRALGELRLVDELLRAYGGRYVRLKAERSALDFDDLELLARDLLLRRAELREHTRERFDHVLVDELQDTNRLQSEILELVARDNLFTVGDDLQAIYGFRGADVGVFARRREAAVAAGRAVRLSESFRSRRAVLDVLDAAFEPALGEDFAPLAAAGSDPAGVVTPRVELIAVDRHSGRWNEALGDEPDPFGAAMRGAPPWRAAEARALAKRVDELITCRDFEPAEVAVLLRSWSDVARYEQALAERGVPTYVAGGGGYWSRQQVADVRAYLATLANPRDEGALVAVIASPLVGASLDALALLRRAAGRGGSLWSALERAFAEDGGQVVSATEVHELAVALPPVDRERISGFVRRLAAERREAPRRSLPDLIERGVCASGYDRAVLAMTGGARRMANLRKLKRLAREFEASEGRDLRGFVDAIDRRGAASTREGEAPLEGEGIHAVRLMTIHAAKGLEFPLVCVGDLGRSDPGDSPLLRVADDGRVGLRLPDPDGRALDAVDARALAAEALQAERQEERRLLWVAATRAQRHLVMSGALDLEGSRNGGDATAMDWVAPALVPELGEAHASGRREGTCVRSWAGREARVAWRVLSPASLGDLLAPADRVPPEVRPPKAPLDERRSRDGRSSAGPAAATPFRELSRISPSALESHRRCGYRHYLERGLGLSAEETKLYSTAERAGERSNALGALARGSIVHELLERLDLRRGDPPPVADVAARLRARGAAATPAEVTELTTLIEGFFGSALCTRMAGADTVRRELPFTFPLEVEGPDGDPRSVLVEGVIDAHCREGARALVVDYKTDRLAPGADLEAACERSYATQRLIYALAALRAGAREVEVAHVFLERPHEPVVARFEAAQSVAAQQRLAGLVGDLIAGHHEPSSSPGAELCRGCPGRAALCSWPPERTGAPLGKR